MHLFIIEPTTAYISLEDIKQIIRGDNNMTVELIKDVLRTEELRGKEETQALVETEVYLNPSKPSIDKILWTDGLVEILTTKVIRDRLIVSGVVKFKIVYKSGEEEGIFTLDCNADFKEEIEIEGITEEMSAFVKSSIEYVQETIIDERKIGLNALISMRSKVEEVNTLEIIKEVKGKEDLQILKETIKYKEIHGRETAYAIVKESFEIEEDNPEIEEILKLTIDAFEQESTVVDDRIIISGTVRVKIIYSGGNKVCTVEEELPFNHFLDIPGAIADSNSELIIEVVEGGYEILENEEGQLKILDIDTKLRISGITYSENEKELIVDAYSTKEKIVIEKEMMNLIENMENISHKENIISELGISSIEEIYSLEGSPTIIDSRFIDDELVVEGILGVQIIYLEKDTTEINTLKEEIPYKFYLPLEDKKTNENIDVDISLDSIKATINPESLSIIGMIKHKITVNRNRVLNVINLIDETGEIIDKKNRPSITIYIVQKGDVLWDIAKRYNTTLEEIQGANENLSPNNIMPGEKIIIEKKVDLSF